MQEAIATVQDQAKIIHIESPQIIISQDKAKINSEIGRLRIYDKKKDGVVLRTDVNYEKLIVYKYDEDTVGYVVILKSISNNNH